MIYQQNEDYVELIITSPKWYHVIGIKFGLYVSLS